MKKILILFAHPAFQKSRINKILIQGLDQIPGVTFHDLYQAYPELDIDVAHEQQLLLEHDVIVLHHPFFWYSTPAILKEWQDLVLEHGWAYGSKGNALKGKFLFNAMTCGGRREAYQTDGFNGSTVRQLLAPIEQTAKLCKMIYLPPFVTHGTHAITPEEIEKKKLQLNQALELLRDEKFDAQELRTLDYFNDYIN